MNYLCSCFCRTINKIGTIQRILAWPLRKDDTHNREAFHIFCCFFFKSFLTYHCDFFVFLDIIAWKTLGKRLKYYNLDPKESTKRFQLNARCLIVKRSTFFAIFFSFLNHLVVNFYLSVRFFFVFLDIIAWITLVND